MGYDPEIIWEEMRQMIIHRGLPNGFLRENPHGIEQLNTIPDAVQEMMLQSFEGIIRIFPVWPLHSQPNASFRGFRACGAFQVSASLKDGEVEVVRVISHKGHPCRIQNPWHGRRVTVEYSLRKERMELCGEILEVPMFPEEEVVLRNI